MPRETNRKKNLSSCLKQPKKEKEKKETYMITISKIQHLTKKGGGGTNNSQDRWEIKEATRPMTAPGLEEVSRPQNMEGKVRGNYALALASRAQKGPMHSLMLHCCHLEIQKNF